MNANRHGTGAQRRWWAACLLLSVAACAEDDIGTSCPMDDLGAAEEGVVAGSFPEVIEVNARFPCDSLVCVSTEGRGSYCSQSCRVDAGCPSAFECRQVNEVGEFAERKFCVWRRCQVAYECGDVSRYQCNLSETRGGRCGFVDEL